MSAHSGGAPTQGGRSRRTPAGEGYTAAHLLVLEGLEAVRKRPGMYIGSTDSRGLMHCVWEIIDNSVDEALGGHCHDIDVWLHPDGSVEVRDDGRGIPVDVEPRTGLSGVEVVFTHLHAGGKFGGGSYSASGGLHGVGASVVNALSARLDVEVDRDGRTYRAAFQRGAAGVFDDDGGPPRADAPFTRRSGLQVVGRTARRVTGTRVRYWADPQVFLPQARFLLDDLLARARQTSFLVPGVTLRVHDDRPERSAGALVDGSQADGSQPPGQAPGDAAAGAGPAGPGGPRLQTFRHDGGIAEFVDFLAEDEAVTDTWRLHGTGHFHETVPVLDDDGHMSMTDVERECVVDIALRWGVGYDTKVRSFVNIIATAKGGTHLAGFEQALLKTLRRQVEANARRLKVSVKDEKIDKEDVLAGLTAVVTARLAEPQFEGQTKEVLGTAAVRSIVARVVERELEALFTEGKPRTRQQAATVLEKVVGEMRTRVSARVHKETQRRKTALETSSLPAKLKDCRSDDVERSELFIVEGDSALGTAKDARDSEYQALLPIRGKILNVQKASVADMLKNAECASIIQVVGAGSGRTFDESAARYGKVIVLADADVDGAHIRTLLLTLFFRYMRPMVEAGRVYAAVPPLHRVEIAGAGGRTGEFVYTYSDAELRALLKNLEKRGRRYKEPIQRYKGLGEMDAGQLAETTLDPRHRTLRRVRITDAEAAERVFELLMGNDVAPRKEFIVAGADKLDRDRIDV